MTADERAIAEAEKVGFDLSVIESNLDLTLEERALRHAGALELVLELRKAGAALHAHAPSTDTATRCRVIRPKMPFNLT